MTLQEKINTIKENNEIKSFSYSGSDLDFFTIDELKRLKDLCLIYEQDYYKYLMLKGKENGKIN